MGNLKNASGEISAQQAADAVAASYKQKKVQLNLQMKNMKKQSAF